MGFRGAWDGQEGAAGVDVNVVCGCRRTEMGEPFADTWE